MDDSWLINLLGRGGAAQAANAKAARAAQLESMLMQGQGASPMQANVPQAAASQPMQMSQSDFFKARSPEERMRQQQALIQKLRSMGQ